METIWELQNKIREGFRDYGPDPSAPYHCGTEAGDLESFESAIRSSTRRDHAISHCQAMARLAR